jgi:hypothetical protein
MKGQISVALLAVLAVSLPARADLLTKLALARSSDPTTRTYFQGLADGMGWANATAREDGKAPLFCQPGKLALTTEQIINIVQRYADKDTFFMDMPLGATMITALKEVFPCR